MYELWPGEPAEGRAVYRKSRTKRTFADHLSYKVFPQQNPDFIDPEVSSSTPENTVAAAKERGCAGRIGRRGVSGK